MSDEHLREHRRREHHSQAEAEREDDGTTRSRRDRPSDDPVLEVEGLTKQFGTGDDAITAVDDVSFSIERGSVVGLLGPNGAGKTTAIRCVLGLTMPDAGRIRIDGVDARAAPHEAHARVDAMLEGARNDYWRLTVRENLRYFACLGGNGGSDARDRHEALVEKFDLADRADEVVRNLSRGMKQKVALASVLASDAALAFLDEPTLGLDVESSLTLRRELREAVRERNTTVVLSSHDMSVVEDVCDRVVVLQDGRVVADDTVASLLETVERNRYRILVRDLGDDAASALRDAFPDANVGQSADPRTITASLDSEGLYDLLGRLAAADARIDAVDTDGQDLESVFLDLVDAGDRR